MCGVSAIKNPFKIKAAEQLLCDQEVPEFVRADHDAVCCHCGKTFIKHPMKKFGEAGIPYLYLHHICDGTWVKL